MPRHQKKIIDMGSAIVIIALIVADGALWKAIVMRPRSLAIGMHALDATKGAALFIAPTGVVVMQGAGSDGSVIGALENDLPPGKRRIDLAIIGEPDESDYGGYASVLDHYSVGAFLYNGRNDIVHSNAWKALIAKITARGIPIVSIGAGDRLFFGRSAEMDIVAPDAVMVQSATASDTRIMARFVAPGGG